MNQIGSQIFRILHDTNIEVSFTWILLVLTILILTLMFFTYLTDNTETYQFIKKL
jgi:hypothetical protein